MITDCPRESSVKSKRFPRHYQVALALATLALLIYWKSATSPALFGDEWGRVSQIAFNNLSCPLSGIFLRPLLGCYTLGLHLFLGNAFWAYSLVSLVWVIVSTFLLYLIVDELFPVDKALSVTTAVLFLVYPADFSKLFFERGSYEMSLLLFLLAVLVLTPKNWTGPIVQLESVRRGKHNGKATAATAIRSPEARARANDS